MLTGADPSCGSLAEGPVRRAGKHKTLYVIKTRLSDTREATILPGIRCAPQNGEMMTRPALRRDIRDHDTKALPVSGR